MTSSSSSQAKRRRSFDVSAADELRMRKAAQFERSFCHQASISSLEERISSETKDDKKRPGVILKASDRGQCWTAFQVLSNLLPPGPY